MTAADPFRHNPDRAILDALTEGIIVRDPEGNVVRFNAAAEAMLGITARQLSGEDEVPEGWHLISDDGTLLAADDYPARRVLLSGESYLNVLGVRRPDGSVGWASVTSRLLDNADGADTLTVTTLVDATAERQAQDELIQGRERIAAIAETAPIGIFTTDADGHCTYVNPQWQIIFGITAVEAEGDGWSQTIHPEDRDEVYRIWREAAAAGRDLHMHFRVRHLDGLVRWVRAGSRAVTDATGAAISHVGTVEDVTTEISNRDAARAAEQRYRVAFENAPMGMIETSGSGEIVFANAAAAHLLGRLISDIEGADVCELLGFDDREALMRAGQDPLIRSFDDVTAHQISTPGGEHRSLLLRVAPFGDDGPSEASSLLLQMADLTDRLKFEDRLRHLANHDPLTGLMNRRSFNEVLDHHTARVKRHGPTGALLIVDIDNFKAVNDTLGHGAGDHVITAVATALQQRLREEDHIARLGGDEIAILATSCDAEHAATLARAVVDTIRNETIALPTGETKRVTASVGVAVFTSDRQGAEAMMTAADIALYDAKDAGRDCFKLSGDEQVSRVGSSISWIDRIEVALATDQLELHAQPIVELATGTTTQEELLIRIIGPGGERIPPGPWMAVAESSGLVRKIDRWVCTKAIERLADTTGTTYEVNLSGISLGDDDLLQLIADGLALRSVDPNRLIIEVTETAAIANLAAAQSFISELRRLGCRFALDDFGAGFGSFYYLKYLPFDFLKIDGEFVRHCDTDATDRAIIRSIVAIASELGTEVIAEHVQNTAVLDTIVSLGVTHAQGYLLGAPTALPENISEPTSRVATTTQH